MAQLASMNTEDFEDITSEDVSNYRYTLNFNPKMWILTDLDYID